MEIRTANKWNLSTDEDCNINETMDAIVCALILEGYHVDIIRGALLGKAEEMVQEFNIEEGGGE
ncbi:MAG: hypothetical protein K6F74_05305 [Prevotella sp.]|nr:hypothetical protein [Prevotella sp.]